MAGTRRSIRADAGRDPAGPASALGAAVAAALSRALPSGGTAAVALSGGRDSMALLDAAGTSAAPGIAFVALHVHHGLSPHADGWAQQAQQACAALHIPCVVERVDVLQGPRTSLEDVARRARYRALAAMAHAAGATVVLLAHHQDDQAETVLLQLLRGAGPRGLAAMPFAHVDQGITWLRPFLAIPRSAIDRHVVQRRLAYVEDDSNARSAHRRNALRHGVIPALRAIAPGYPATIARAALHQAEAAELLRALGAADAAPHFDGDTLACAALGSVADARARNVLRWFIEQHGLPPPSAARLASMLAQLCTTRHDAAVEIRHAGAALGLFGGRIAVHALAPPPFEAAWHGEPRLILPHGSLQWTPEAAGTLDTERLFAVPVHVRSRTGGERLCTMPNRPARPLKDLLREAAIPPWTRAALPLVYADDVLVAVPGVGVHPAFRAEDGVPGATLTWQAAPIARMSAFG